MKVNRCLKRGFTLIELMIVLVVLGTLMTILFVSLQDSGIDDKQAKIKLQAARMKLDVKLFEYRNQFGSMPSSGEGLSALVTPPAGGKGLLEQKDIMDPWGNPYIYSNEDGRYSIKSLGADGKEGGEGPAADIVLNDM